MEKKLKTCDICGTPQETADSMFGIYVCDRCFCKNPTCSIKAAAPDIIAEKKR